MGHLRLIQGGAEGTPPAAAGMTYEEALAILKRRLGTAEPGSETQLVVALTLALCRDDDRPEAHNQRGR